MNNSRTGEHWIHLPLLKVHPRARTLGLGIILAILLLWGLDWIGFLQTLLQRDPAAAAHPTAQTNAPLVRKSNSPFQLHSRLINYTYIFTGTLSCGEATCQNQQVHLSLSTPRHADIEKVADVTPDGRYTLKISLLEKPDEAIDWKLSAGSSEMRGHNILTHESTVVIERSIYIP